MLIPAARAPKFKLAIYRTSSIGDVVLGTALIDLLRYLDIPSEIYWVCRQPAMALLEASYPEIEFVEIKSADERSEQLAKVEKLPHLHAIIDLQKSFRSHYICRYLSRIHQAPVYSWTKDSLRRNQLVLEARLWGRSRELPERATVAPRRQYQAMCEALREALRNQFPDERLYGLETYDAIPVLPLAGNSEPRGIVKEVMFGSWLALAPGAAHPTKRAPQAFWHKLLTRIRDRVHSECGEAHFNDLGLLILGDDEDRSFALEILNDLNWPGAVLNLAGKASLSDAAYALRRCRVLLSNDSSLAHIAEAVNTPALVFFGPTVEGFGFSPRMTQSQAYSCNLGCRPCSRHGKSLCRYGDQRCFSDIAQEPIAMRCVELLIGD